MKLPLKVTQIEGDNDFVNVRDADNQRIVVAVLKADGEAIVSACNNHDQLVAALNSARAALCEVRIHGAGVRVIGVDIDAIDVALLAVGAQP